MKTWLNICDQCVSIQNKRPRAHTLTGFHLAPTFLLSGNECLRTRGLLGGSMGPLYLLFSPSLYYCNVHCRVRVCCAHSWVTSKSCDCAVPWQKRFLPRPRHPLHASERVRLAARRHDMLPPRVGALQRCVQSLKMRHAASEPRGERRAEEDVRGHPAADARLAWLGVEVAPTGVEEGLQANISLMRLQTKISTIPAISYIFFFSVFFW